ncbi:MAG TPA: hypothetical protein VKG26_09905 [Bacteroidia bacterium]|nr:hypothetical protein [Bacteroidia bacterium]
MEITANQKLDAVLLYLDNDKVNKGNGEMVDMVPLGDAQIQKGLKIRLDDRAITLVMDKLLRDKYVNYNPVNQTYWINFDGKTFIQNGGYFQEKINRDYKNNIETRLREEVRRISKTNLLLTIVLAFATAIAAVYYGIEIWKFFNPAITK